MNNLLININLDKLKEILDNKIIYNYIIDQIGLYNYKYLYNANFKLNPLRLRRESTCQTYMQCCMTDPQNVLDKKWFQGRLIRAKQKQRYLTMMHKRYNNGDGLLLYDMIHSLKSTTEILLFRIVNANNKYNKYLSHNLDKILNGIPENCIYLIINYLIYRLDTNRPIHI